MEPVQAENLASILTSIATYGGKVAGVFHSYVLIADKIPEGIEGATNVLDATVTTIKQALSLVKEEADDSNGKKIFSSEGLSYMGLLARECANSLAKIEPIIAENCSDKKDYKARRKQKKKASFKKAPVVNVDPFTLKLDEEDFLNKVEKVKWTWATDDIGDCIERIYDIQLHLMLVFLVAKVGALSQDLSSGKVDVESIVSHHDRIHRTAELIGIKLPRSQFAGRRGMGSVSDSFSSSGSSYDSGSDSSSTASIKPRKKYGGPPPPPPPGWPRSAPPPNFPNSSSRPPNGPPTLPGISSFGPPPPNFPNGNFKSSVGPLPGISSFGPPPPPGNLPSPPPPPSWVRGDTVKLGPGGQGVPSKGVSLPRALPGPVLPYSVNYDNMSPDIKKVNPPAYSEGKPSPGSVGSLAVSGAASQSSIVTPSPQSAMEKQPQTIFSKDEKKSVKDEEEDQVETVTELEPPVPGQVFNARFGGMRFKIKSLFQSKETIASEMRQTLLNTESRLIAYFIQRHESREIPHSAFHSLETTHMKMILSQLNDNTWYKTFSSLNFDENQVMNRLLHPFLDGCVQERELVVLKVIEENRLNAWMTLLGRLLQNRSFHHIAKGRMILAIMREKLVDGKPMVPRLAPPVILAPPRTSLGKKAPPGPTVPASPPFRSAPQPYIPPQRGFTMDLRGPPPFIGREATLLPHQAYPPPRGPPPPPNPPPQFPSTNASPGAAGLRVTDVSPPFRDPVSDAEASIALVSYNEYTIRKMTDRPNNCIPPWTRVSVTAESTEKHVLADRILDFERDGGSVIETKLRLTEQQSAQVSRLIDELKCAERDCRFEWCLAEITLYNHIGEIKDFIGPRNAPIDAVVIHLIAKRSLKSQHRPIEVYNALKNGIPPPPIPGNRPPMPPPPPPRGVPIHIKLPKKRGKIVDSSSESDSDPYDSFSDSNSSVGGVRRRLRKMKAKKVRASRRRTCYIDSDDDSEIESDDDMIKLDIQLKRGDSVVSKLLEKWTPKSASKDDLRKL